MYDLLGRKDMDWIKMHIPPVIEKIHKVNNLCIVESDNWLTYFEPDIISINEVIIFNGILSLLIKIESHAFIVVNMIMYIPILIKDDTVLFSTEMDELLSVLHMLICCLLKNKWELIIPVIIGGKKINIITIEFLK